MRDDTAIFILSHGRPGLLRTATGGNLRLSGYTGDWYIVLDDEDETAPEYRRLFGAARILTFTKDDAAQDLGDNHDGPRGVIIYARNAVAQMARDLGYRYYVQLDDDYYAFGHRFTLAELMEDPARQREAQIVAAHLPKNSRLYRPTPTKKLRYCATRNIDAVIDATVEFLETTGALTVAWAQGGDLIGGAISRNYRLRVLRKAMNSFVARTDRPIKFVGRINEDVNTYVTAGARGEVLLTFVDFGFSQKPTQSNTGGMSTAYLDSGTYLKSFYAVMYAPSCVRIGVMGDKHMRIHHSVSWEHAVPKIVSGHWRKPNPTERPN